MRIALENLLGNAWKYTRDKTPAEIELGTRTLQGEQEFFAPFERIHPKEQYEGTGIGLATVKPVLDCHGGQVWAQAMPGHGATLFFTLPLDEPT